MFGRDKVMRDGEKVFGRVTESGSALSFSTGGQGYHIKARIEFDDGITSEISCKVHRGLGAYDVGEVLPFRFDPADRSKIVLDEPALKKYGEEMKAKVKEIERENAERPIPRDEPRKAEPGPYGFRDLRSIGKDGGPES